MTMRVSPEQRTHKKYQTTAWVNPTTEALRPEECLCLNCGNMKPGEDGHCHIATKLYTICLDENVAMAITRCPLWTPKPAELPAP